MTATADPLVEPARARVWSWECDAVVLPAEPFLRLLDGRGGAAASGVRSRSWEEKAIERARRSGRLTELMADRLTIGLLNLTPREFWGRLTAGQSRTTTAYPR